MQPDRSPAESAPTRKSVRSNADFMTEDQDSQRHLAHKPLYLMQRSIDIAEARKIPTYIMRDFHTPSSGPPAGNPPGPHILQKIGEEGVRQLLRLHYNHLLKSSIAHMFPTEPDAVEFAAQKNADFFIQLMGGTPHFSTKRGPPRRRARHMPFEITDRAKDVWLDCFFRAMDDLPFPEEDREEFKAFLVSFAGWMVNSAKDSV